MRYRGEVTVFLTMILVSIMTLLLVVVESARGRITGSWDLKQGKRKDWNRNLAIFLLLMQRRKTGIR